MGVFLVLLTAILAAFFLNLFFQLARVEKGLQNTVTLLEKFMVLRYNLKKDSLPGENPTEGQNSA
jgi:hypothetical protein